MTPLTPAQTRALIFLSDNGAKLTNAPRAYSAALSSLALYHPDLVEHAWGEFGPRGARKLAYWLTPAGIALRQQMESGT